MRSCLRPLGHAGQNYGREGETVPVGTPVCLIETESEVHAGGAVALLQAAVPHAGAHSRPATAADAGSDKQCGRAAAVHGCQRRR